MKIRYCNGKRLRRALSACTKYLIQMEEEVNRINVFPVPDADTGSNMSTTLKKALENILELEDLSLTEVATKFAEGSFYGAKGCSGIIISQFFKGFCEGIDGKNKLNTKELADCFEKGAFYAYRSVEDPKEGTILTVIKEIAKEAKRISSIEDDIFKLLDEILAHGKKILKNSFTLLPELKEAQVVDAGGLGFIAILEGVVKLIKGEIKEEYEDILPKEKKFLVSQSIKYPYCCEVIVKVNKRDPKEIKEELMEFGDSLLMVRDGENLKVHLHNNSPGRFLKLLEGIGELLKIKIDNMKLQHEKAFIKERINIVTDSTCDLPEDILKKYDIIVVPLWVNIEGTSYKDKVDITCEDFYRKLKEATKIPITSQPSPEQFLKVYQEIDKGISIHISSKISGTLNSASLALKSIDKERNIILIDSYLASLGLGLLVLEAARISSNGKDLEEVVEEISEIKKKIKCIFTLDTLEYLQKGGRIGKAKEILANLLNIKPLLTMEEGIITPLGKAKGKERVIPEIIEMMKKDIRDNERIKVAVAHADCIVEAERLRLEIERNFHCEELFIGKIGAVIGTHVGPNALGVFYFKI